MTAVAETPCRWHAAWLLSHRRRERVRAAVEHARARGRSVQLSNRPHATGEGADRKPPWSGPGWWVGL